MTKLYKLKHLMGTKPKIYDPSKKLPNIKLSQYQNIFDDIYSKYHKYFIHHKSYAAVIQWYFGEELTVKTKRDDSNNISDLFALCYKIKGVTRAFAILNESKLNLKEKKINYKLVYRAKPKNLKEYKDIEKNTTVCCRLCKKNYNIIIDKGCKCGVNRFRSEKTLKKFKASRKKTDNSNYHIGALKREREFDRRSIEENKNVRNDWKLLSNLKQSKTMKRKIREGTFTPCVTNSWAKSRCYINNIPFRSSWEAYFYLYNINKNIKYENIRIKYYDSERKESRIYITDFSINNIIIEIKPNCNLKNQTVIDKENAAKKWCLENNYIFKFITDEWFFKHYDETLIFKNCNIIPEETKLKMIRNLKQFKGK